MGVKETVCDKKIMLNQIRRKLDFEACKLLAPRCNVEHFLRESQYLERNT